MDVVSLVLLVVLLVALTLVVAIAARVRARRGRVLLVQSRPAGGRQASQ